MACALDGTFLLPPSAYVFTYVRNPITRFISGIYPHGKWKSSDICNGIPCEAVKKKIIAHIQNYFTRRKFPASVGIIKDKVGRRMPHWLTQSYFLSATRASGKPVIFQDVFKLEENASVKLPPRATREGGALPHRATPASRADNVGGEADAKAAILLWIQREPRVACSLCRVYAQDFVCLGYPIPDICAKRCILLS